MFETFDNRVVVRATLEMETALSVGSRLSFEPTGTDLPVMKGPDGRPFIFGSSIKGAVRALTERILRSIPNGKEKGLWACDPFGEPCIQSEQARIWLRNEQEDRFWDEACTACRIFGSPWLASRVAFKDAYLENAEDLPVLTQIRDGVGIDRNLGAARQGVKYDFEVVVPGALFGIEILTENLEDWELGLLLSVLRFWEEGHLALGGKVTRGPGWGRLKDLRLERIDQSNLLTYLTGGQPAQESPGLYLQAFQDFVNQHLGNGEG